LPRFVIHCRGEDYRIDRSTPLFWPHAYIISPPEDPLELQLIPVASQLLRMASEEGFLCDLEQTEEQLIAMAIEGYRSKGHQAWNINEALHLVVVSPDSDLAASLTQCLERWFFIEKLPQVGLSSQKPKNRKL